ncbi:MAG: peptidoglycan recognition protein family protein, partial [Chloroflexota bacterium]|nr:peptidoglycan recognition protein family protein [Chloroflexota bacterium]
MPSSPQPRTDPLTRRLDRRVVLKASAGLAAMSLLTGRATGAAAGSGLTGTIAGEWREAQAGPDVDLSTSEQTAGDDGIAPRRRRFRTDFTFYAVAPHWSGEAEPGATVELSLSADGETWSEPVSVRQADAENGRPERDGRRFGQLVATEGASYVAYQGFDAAGEPTTLPDLAFAYIDATPGPTLAEAQQPALDPAFAPPPIVSRQAWGADEALRYGPQGEIWPVAYAPVEHVVIHHTDTANFEDPLVAIRSVYYYHAVVRGWGDVGYNYLVDFLGNVYEGRVGGEGAVAGHAAGYNERTAGIGTIGRFDFQAATPEAQTALVWITAWAGRNLNPLGAKPFGEIASLPTICAHRDVNPTACPGDALYGGLAALRDYVDAVLAGATSPELPSPDYLPGDAVVAVVADAPVQATPETGAPVVARLPLGEALTIADGPATVDGEVW